MYNVFLKVFNSVNFHRIWLYIVMCEDLIDRISERTHKVHVKVDKEVE